MKTVSENFSERDLSIYHEESIPAKGLKNTSILEDVTPTEPAITLASLNPSEEDSMLQKVCQTLYDTNLPPANIIKELRKVLSDFRKEENIVVDRAADRSKCFVA